MIRFPGPQAAAWWHALQPNDGPGRLPGDRGALARLRRCATVMDAASEPTTLALCRKLGSGEAGLERAALLAAVLAHVRSDHPERPVARQIGVQQDGTTVMSELRFRRLLQPDSPDEQLIGFRRMVALAGRALHVADLAAGLWRWDDDATRRQWIYAYYDAPEFPVSAAFPRPVSEDATA